MKALGGLVMLASFGGAGPVMASGVQPGGVPRPPEAQVVAEGRALAERLCAQCHAIGPSGVSPFNPAPPFRVIARRYDVWNLAEAFAEGIVVGHPAMPVFEFEAPDIGALLAYLRSLED